MPRAKADNVVIHRIELGGKERELAESALAAFQFNRVATPLVDGLKDVSFVATVTAILAIFYPDLKNYLPEAPVDPQETINAVTDWFDNRRTEAQQYGQSVLDTAGDVVDTASWWAALNPFTAPLYAAQEIVDEVT
jgi:hypothetical protein